MRQHQQALLDQAKRPLRHPVLSVAAGAACGGGLSGAVSAGLGRDAPGGRPTINSIATSVGEPQELRCVRENVKLGAANSTIGALLTRGAPILGGGIIQVESEAEGRVSLSRYMDVEPWFEITNPDCLDAAIDAILHDRNVFKPPNITRKSDYGAIPGQEIVRCFPKCSFVSMFLEPRSVSFGTSEYDYPGRGIPEITAGIDEQTRLLGDDPELGPYWFNRTSAARPWTPSAT
jgi:hypothetical protein